MTRKILKAPLFILIIVMMLLLAALGVILPDKSISQLENRPLMSFPVLSFSQISNGRWMSQAEDYINDQLPLRDAFIQLNLLKERMLLKTETNGVVRGMGDRLFGDIRQINSQDLEKSVNALGQFVQKHNLPFIFVMVPPSSLMYPDALPAFYPLADPLIAIEQAIKQHPAIDYLSVKSVLLLENQTQMTHYRTDHHLTAAGAKIVYQALVKRLGLREDIQDAEVMTVDGFTGSYYARAPYPFLKKDALSYYDVKNITLDINGVRMPGLADKTLLDSPNKYHALLYNNPGLLTLSNKEGERDSALVFKDSNANAILPLLARHYQNLHVIDFRYLRLGFDLEAFIKNEGIKEVICIYGTDVFLTDRNLLLHLLPKKS
ncbi:MAG: hypothetical protein GXZ04_08385 [Clostridiales bacterium]|nr:hypothetical protein [Clostridiales bacterium]